jgi:hypothetical protein
MVRYGQSPADQFAFQIDFRAVPKDALGPFACGLDIWLSVQTQLLDSHPTLGVGNHVPTAHWTGLDGEGRVSEQPDPAALVCDKALAAVTLFIHPSDREQAELIKQPSQFDSACWLRLFGNFMEKGVIRRGRLRYLFNQTPIDRSALAAAYAQFASSPLPLTA